jgi:hypothetical protein
MTRCISTFMAFIICLLLPCRFGPLMRLHHCQGQELYAVSFHVNLSAWFSFWWTGNIMYILVEFIRGWTDGWMNARLEGKKVDSVTTWTSL